MIRRTLHEHLITSASRYPTVTLTGPRQSGKTTLCRMAFPDASYVSLENPANREFADEDPLRFLARSSETAIIDEVQRVPDLLSYIQGIVDDDPRSCRFILTGSQNLTLIEAVSQSLAGRTALLRLLPLGLEELRLFPDAPSELFATLVTGGYPRIQERQLPPEDWLADYTATYLERDVRRVRDIGDLLRFQTFLRLCAGRTGQLLNLSSLASDCGIANDTAGKWLSVLEATFIAYRLPPYHSNLGKRLIKTPKLYFYDSGLVCNLLGIEKAEHLDTHPLRGAIFETWVVGEVVKHLHHRGRRPRLYFYRDQSGLEIDLLIERGPELSAVEIKSAQTPASSMLSALKRFATRVSDAQSPEHSLREPRIVVYGGAETQHRNAGTLLAWSDIASYDWFSL